MPVNNLSPGVKPLAPIRDISAKIPPSPRLSARITIRQYLIETVRISVQTMSERMPSAAGAVNRPPMACTTVCSVYSGLVPRSPKTMPSAAVLAQCAGWAAPTGGGLLIVMDAAPHPDRTSEIAAAVARLQRRAQNGQGIARHQ